MDDLRWILLVAGALLIAGVYLWGLRGRRRAAPGGSERAARTESQAVARPGSAARRIEPEVGAAEQGTDVADAPPAMPAADAAAPDERVAPAARREPRIDASEPVQPVAPQTRESPAAAANEPRRMAPAQKIVAVRVVAAGGAPFEGVTLRQAIEQAGLRFGRYRIFHRLDAQGRTLFSLASLKEPGTFELEAMNGSTYRGVAMFLVLPAAVSGERALEELLSAARALAARLGGHLQDERGASLDESRVGQLRQDVASFERGAAAGR